MSNTVLNHEPEVDDCQFENIFNQLEQYFPLRHQVASVLTEANAALAAQCTQPDGYRYMQTCDDLAKFLDLKVPLEYSEQQLVVQVIQVACAMHENAINNPALTEEQRSTHYLAAASLVCLCQSALESGVTYTELWCDVFCVSHRAEKAFDKAIDALDLSKYLDFGNVSGSDAGQTSAALSPVPTAFKPATPKGSVHDITADIRSTSRSTKLKDKALAMLNDRPNVIKGPPLGRAHTMPSLSQTTSSSYPSRTSSKAYSRGHGLPVLQETEE